jgi:hypothetical protein
VKTNDEKQNQRRELSKRAWAEAFKRLFAAAGSDWPTGTNLSTPEIDRAEKAGQRGHRGLRADGPGWGTRGAGKVGSALMMLAIQATKGKRGCDECGQEKVVEVVDKDGRRSCGRCLAGTE